MNLQCISKIIIAVAFLCAPELLQSEDNKSGDLPAVKSLDRIELFAAPDKSRYNPGDTVVLKVFTTNNSGSAKLIFDTTHNVGITVLWNERKDVRKPWPTDRHERITKLSKLDGSDFGTTLEPHRALPGEITLNEDFDLTQPGKYSVTLRRYFSQDPDGLKRQLDSKKVKNYIETTTEVVIEK